MANTVRIRLQQKTADKLVANLNATRGRILTAGFEAIDSVAATVKSRAWETCPVYRGYLRDSLYMESEMNLDSIQAIIGHGGRYNKLNAFTGKYTDEYAVVVHESLKLSVNSALAGATSKWLEKSLNSVRSEYLGILKAYVGAALRGNSEAQLNNSLARVKEAAAKRQAKSGGV
jgi:hypothetical protein